MHDAGAEEVCRLRTLQSTQAGPSSHDAQAHRDGDHAAAGGSAASPHIQQELLQLHR